MASGFTSGEVGVLTAVSLGSTFLSQTHAPGTLGQDRQPIAVLEWRMSWCNGSLGLVLIWCLC